MFTQRMASEADLPALRAVMDLAIAELLREFLEPAQIEASRQTMGLDTQLVADRTYFIIEEGDAIAGCGGWSRRATLYGGDHSIDLRNASLLDPEKDAARVRAMYTHPAFARRGVGRMILGLAEGAARSEGFRSVQLMATLAGEPLYRACGYHVIERSMAAPVNGVEVPLILMGKHL